MLVDRAGEFIKPDRLKRIRRRLRILSAAETEDACRADKQNASNFLYKGGKYCSFCGVQRKLHTNRNGKR